MNNLQVLQSARRVLHLRSSALPATLVRHSSDAPVGDRPWDKSTRAVVYELADVTSPAEMKSRNLPGVDPHSSQAYQPKSDRNALKGRLAEAHYDLRYQNWERNQNRDFRSLMRQWDVQQQTFKTSRLIKHQEYGTFESHRGNISGRPGPSNSTPMTMHDLAKTKAINAGGQLSNNAERTTMLPSGAKVASKH